MADKELTPEEKFDMIMARLKKMESMPMATPPISVTQQEYDALQEAYSRAFGHS